MKTWREELLKNNDLSEAKCGECKTHAPLYENAGVNVCHDCLTRNSCEWCGSTLSLYNTPMGEICDACLDSDFESDNESLSNEERNA
jgi:hypothetical protein